MSTYSKGTWLWISFVMLAMLILIGLAEDRMPQGQLSTDVMVGIVVSGYGSIFAWLYLKRAPVTPAKHPQDLRFVKQVGNRSVYARYEVKQDRAVDATAPAALPAASKESINN